jgi:hypothetical protein
MKKILRIALFTFFLPMLGRAAENPKIVAAKDAAVKWVGLIDAGKCPDSWTQASSFFQAKITSAAWCQMVNQVRNSMGALAKRDSAHAKATYSKSLPGVPDGEYVVIEYNSSFKQKASAIETVSVQLDKDKKWHVAGYFIK